MATIRYLVGDVDDSVASTGPGGAQGVLEDPSGNPVELSPPAQASGETGK